MRGSQAGRWFPVGVSRLVAFLLLVVLSWAHPAPAAVLHYCSQAGRLIEPGHDCCKLKATAPCCAGGKEHSAGGVSINAASCVDCCELFTLDEIDLADALVSSSTREVETVLRNSSTEPIWNASSGQGSDSSLALQPQSPPPGRVIYLLACRFLI